MEHKNIMTRFAVILLFAAFLFATILINLEYEKPETVYLDFVYADRISTHDGFVTDKEAIRDIVDDINGQYTVVKKIDGVSDYGFTVSLQDKHQGDWDCVGDLYIIDKNTVAFEGVGKYYADEDVTIQAGYSSTDAQDFMWIMKKDEKLNTDRIKTALD